MATYYWIGGTGNWNDTAKWSLTSNGTTASAVPTAADDVIFDINSDGAASANFTVTANAPVAANNITVTTDRVITFDGGASNLSANFWTQNSTASTTGAILNNTISINSNVTITRGIFNANGNLNVGDTFRTFGFGTPATANRVMFTLGNTLICKTFDSNTPNSATWYYKNFTFNANSRLYMTGTNREIFTMQSTNTAFTFGSNVEFIANGAGNVGETRTVFTNFFTGATIAAATPLTMPTWKFTAGSDNLELRFAANIVSSLDFTGFSGTANIFQNTYTYGGNLVLSNTMSFTSASGNKFIFIGGWANSNTGIVTNGLANAKFSFVWNPANTTNHRSYINTFPGTSFVLDDNANTNFIIGNTNFLLGNSTLASNRMAIQGNHTINFADGGQIVLTGSNTNVFVGPQTFATQTITGNVNITSNYTGGVGTRRFDMGYSDIVLKVTGSNGLIIGNTATDNISILSNSAGGITTVNYSGRARFDLTGMTNMLNNDRRAVDANSIWPTSDKLIAGSNPTAFNVGNLDTRGTVFNFPIYLGAQDSGIVYIRNNNLVTTSNIFLIGQFNDSVRIENVKVVGTTFDSSNTITASSKQLWFNGPEAEVVMTAGNAVIFNNLGNTSQIVANTGIKFRSNYTGSEGTRSLYLGIQPWASANTSNLTYNTTVSMSNTYARSIVLNTEATDTVLANGNITALDLTGMNCTWNQGNMTVFGNVTFEETTGNFLATANTLTLQPISFFSNAITITGKNREFKSNISFATNQSLANVLSINSNLVLSDTLTFSQMEGNVSLLANSYLKTGVYQYLVFVSSPQNGRINFGANTGIEITGSNRLVWDANRDSSFSFAGSKANIYFSYAGSTGTRFINNGGAGLSASTSNAQANNYNFGTNNSSEMWFNPAATDTISFVNQSNINDLNMTNWTGNLVLGNSASAMMIRGNINLPANGNVSTNATSITWSIYYNGVQRSMRFNSKSLAANLTCSSPSASFGGDYIFLDDVRFVTSPTPSGSNSYGLVWQGGNLAFTPNISVTTGRVDFSTATSYTRYLNTGNVNILLTGGNGLTVFNYTANNLVTTGQVRVLSQITSTANIATGTRGFAGEGLATAPFLDIAFGNDYINNTVVISSYTDNVSIGSRFRNMDLSSAIATQNMVLTPSISGNITMPASNGVIADTTGTLTLIGNSTTQYLNFANRTWGTNLTINCPNTTAIFGGNLNIANANLQKTLTLSNGTLDMNGYSLTTGTFLTGTGTKSIIWDGGRIVVGNSSVTAWNANVPAGFTTSAGTSPGRIVMAGTAAKTFVGGNINYNATLDLNGAGNLTITGNNQFRDIVMTYAAANNFIIFPASGNTTVETFTGSGVNNTVRLGLASSTAGTRSNIHLTGNGVTNGNWANISDINFTPLVTNGTSPMAWYVGANSLNSSNVSGALFTNYSDYPPKVYVIESGTAFTIPADWNNSNNVIYLYGAGGGGAGGRPTSATNKAAGAGGGGGGFTAVANFSAAPGATIAYEVGLGGAGGAANANGTAGGNTIWATVYTANGGGGGATTATPTSVPGVGGTGANANGGNGGFGTFSTVSGNGMGAGGGGGAGGPNGTGGAGGNGFASTTAANTAGGGGGGSGGGGNGVNATVTAAGTGGNNAVGFGGGAAGAVGRQGGGGGGGRNTAAAGKGGPGVDVLNSIGGGGGAGATANLAGSNNDVIRTYGGGGPGGGVTTATTGFAGGSGANGVILVVYTAASSQPVFDSTSTMFLVF